MTGLNGGLIPLRNNAAGKMTGLEVILNNLITEYFPIDKQYKGFNVRIHWESLLDYGESGKIMVSVN